MNIAKHIWLLLWTSLATTALAQNYTPVNDIPVMIGPRALRAAWAGGLTAPQLSSIDLDNDGILDLLIYDRDGNQALTFRNGGTSGQTDFHYRPEFAPLFPGAMSDWVLLRDFDGDGKMDIFTAVPQVSDVRVFRNTSMNSGGTLSFALHQDTVMTNYPPFLPLYSGKSDLPAIDDIDGDGDLDFLTFQLGGTKVEFHKNLSVEQTGGLLGMEFTRASRCFGHFEEDISGCTALIGRVPCGAGQRMPEIEPSAFTPNLHAGSTILALDLDSNGLRDLLVGDISCSTLYGLYNGGTTAIADFVTQEELFPVYDTAARVLLFPASYYLDWDNDGKRDLLVAPNNVDQVEDQKSIQYFKNSGFNDHPRFNFQRYGVMQDEMIDMGTGSMPAFLDYNADGLPDLLVGGAGRYDSLVGFVPQMELYENTGTAQQPRFSLVSGDYLNLRSLAPFANATHLHPTAGDLDGDGDQDLLLGNSDGAIFHFINTAGPNNPASYSLLTPNFANIDVGTHSAPQLVDLDGDLDLDLLVGDLKGYVHYYNNHGTVSVPSYILVSDTFGHVKINNFSGMTASNGMSQPFANDYDQDGDLDLLVGGIEGEIQVFENLSVAANATFSRVADFAGRDFGSSASLSAAVLDSNRLSFVVGSHRGGLMLLRDTGPVGVISAAVSPTPRLQLFPNPATVEVQYKIEAPQDVHLQAGMIVDALGRIVWSQPLTGQAGRIDISNLKAGVYVVSLIGKYGRVSQRLVVTGSH